MNINEIFKRLNAGIAECKDGIARESDRGRQVHLDGIKTGLEAALKVINDVNFDPPTPVGRLNCIGYGARKGTCGGKVPNKFLQLYCNVCNSQRLKDRGVVEVVEDDVFVITFVPGGN